MAHEIDVTEGLIPLDEFRSDPDESIRHARETGTPVVVTEGGRAIAVLLSPAEYNRLRDELESDEAVTAARADFAAGRLVDHERVAAWLSTWGTPAEPGVPIP